MKICVAVCATVLLVASLSGRPADADSSLARIKGLFRGQKSYATLADHLYRETKSDELVDNTKAAGSLLSKHPESEEDVTQLVRAFGALIGDSSNPESFCSKDNLANLRRVAEGLRDGGNLGPKTITAAILRLNKIVVKVVGAAREVCDPYLTGRWPEPWQARSSDWAMVNRINKLHGVAKSFSYEGFVFLDKPSFEPGYQAGTISYAIARSEQQSPPIDPNEPDLPTTKNTVVIGKQLEEYVYKPCAKFVLLKEAQDVLVPFNDMLKSWYVVNSGLLKKYFENADAYKPQVTTRYFDTKVRDLAFSYQACQSFFATPKEDLAKRIRQDRIEDSREGDILAKLTS